MTNKNDRRNIFPSNIEKNLNRYLNSVNNIGTK